MPELPIIHCDDVPEREAAHGDIAFRRRRLGAAAGAARIGLSLFAVPPQARQIPVHVHGDEEEITYVLRGEGLTWQDDEACAIGPGDTIVHLANAETHTLLAGAAGLEVLAFASGSDTRLTYLPRAGVMWAGPRWVPLDAPHPFEAEAAAGALPRPEPGPRPANVVALADVPVQERGGTRLRTLGAAGGSRWAGLNHVTLPPGGSGAPAHCHALEEELFVVLAGSGTVTLGEDEHPLRAGSIVARPPATGVAHALRAGEEGLSYLAYGTRVAGDSVYYPQLGTVRLRGLGVTIAAGG